VFQVFRRKQQTFCTKITSKKSSREEKHSLLHYVTHSSCKMQFRAEVVKRSEHLYIIL